MSQTAILWPMIAQVVLIYCVYALMARRRHAAIAAGNASHRQFRERTAEPGESVTAYNNLVNQVELPVLFFPACLALFATNGSSFVVVTLAWVFVVSRYAHAWIHVTSNRLRYRRPAFVVGFVCLALMWLWLALHLLAIV